MKLIARPTLNDSNLHWALWWAQQGWQIIPLYEPLALDSCSCGNRCSLSDRGKHPRISAGPDKSVPLIELASTDQNVIRKWWTKWPKASIGGTPPKHVSIVDLDPRSLPEGTDFPDFPPTWTHLSGRGDGGRHLLYAAHPRLTTGAKIWPAVDIKTSGKGYVVLPPSLHAATMQAYLLDDSLGVASLPDQLFPATPQGGTKATRNSNRDPALKLLMLPVDSPELGDDAMLTIAGWVARRVQNKAEFDALLYALNQRLEVPLDDTAMSKKDWTWEQERKKVHHQAELAPGWLIEEVGYFGYCTTIGKGDNIDTVPWSDFRVQARGLVVYPDRQTWIVDFHKADGSVLLAQRLPSSVLASTSALRRWLIGRGMSLLAPTNDTRGNHGERLMKLLQSHDAPVLELRDHYGWCSESGSFVVPDGQITVDGFIPHSIVFPDDALMKSAPCKYGFEADLNEVRAWILRLMGLQAPTVTAQLFSWLMMLLLREQWFGLLPGVLVEASAGTGKTMFFQLFSALAGVPQEGENPTKAVARDLLSGNSSGFLWLDDVRTSNDMEQLVRKTITQGAESLKTPDGNGAWSVNIVPLRGSVVITGEGAEWYRQKAYRDRFLNLAFGTEHRVTGLRALKEQDLSRGSGTLVSAVLRLGAPLLASWPALQAEAVDREGEVSAALIMGARVLDAVMDTRGEGGHPGHYEALVTGTPSSEDVATPHASECVRHVFPTLWRQAGQPMNAGNNGLSFPIWFDTARNTFWISAAKCYDAWSSMRANARQQQLTTQANIRRELDACGAGGAQVKWTHGEDRVSLKYRPLNGAYADLILAIATDND